jgi:hypothetical protein
VAVYNGWRRFDAFPSTHPQFAGNLPYLPAEVTEPLRGADVILAVGTRMGDFTSLNYTVPGAAQRLVQIDLSPESITATRDGDVALVADARTACTALLRLLADDPGEEQLAGQRRRSALEAGRHFQDRSAPGGCLQVPGPVLRGADLPGCLVQADAQCGDPLLAVLVLPGPGYGCWRAGAGHHRLPLSRTQSGTWTRCGRPGPASTCSSASTRPAWPG